VKVIPQNLPYSAPSVHLVIPDVQAEDHVPAEEIKEAPGGFQDSRSQMITGEDLLTVPNPGVEFMQLQWYAGESGPGVVEVLDAQGKLFITQKYEILRGENVIVFDMTNAESGLYVVRLRVSTGISIGKWMKVHN
jgi:hypothetical protein